MAERARVAVIDDETAIGELVKRILARDYEVDNYAEVESFFANLEEGRSYRAILCDLYMQGVSGMEIYDRLAQHWPDQAQAMIFMSGVSSAEMEANIPGDAPRNILEKPFDMKSLRQIVGRVIAESSKGQPSPPPA